jgi:hypothetical protein
MLSSRSHQGVATHHGVYPRSRFCLKGPLVATNKKTNCGFFPEKDLADFRPDILIDIKKSMLSISVF